MRADFGDKEDFPRFIPDESFPRRPQECDPDCKITNCQYHDVPFRAPSYAKGLYPYMEDLARQQVAISSLLSFSCCDKKQVSEEYGRMVNQNSHLADDIKELEDNIRHFPASYCRVSDNITRLSRVFHKSIGEKNKNRQIENLQRLLSLIAATTFSYLYISGEPEVKISVMAPDRGDSSRGSSRDYDSPFRDSESRTFRPSYERDEFSDESSNRKGSLKTKKEGNDKDLTFWEKVSQALKGEAVSDLRLSERRPHGPDVSKRNRVEDSKEKNRSKARRKLDDAEENIQEARGDIWRDENREARRNISEAERDLREGERDLERNSSFRDRERLSLKERQALDKMDRAEENMYDARGNIRMRDDRGALQDLGQAKRDLSDAKNALAPKPSQDFPDFSGVEKKMREKKNGPAGRAIKKECDCGTPNSPCKKKPTPPPTPRYPSNDQSPPSKYTPFNKSMNPPPLDGENDFPPQQ